MIGLLLRSRYVTAGATAILLVLLVLFGKKVRYEQSIGSFFADDDPYMAVYQKAGQSFGDDNFVFLVYDDTELVSPAGLDRVGELAAAVRPERIGGVLRVESLDAMPLVWSIDDVLIALDRLPALARKAALGVARRTVKNVDLKTNAMTVSGAVRGADAAALSRLKDRLRQHPLFRGTLIDQSGTTTAVVVRLRKTNEHNVIETVKALRSAADEFAARHGIAQAGGGRTAGAPGRRLRGDRGRWPAAGGGGHGLDRPGHAFGRA